MEFSELAARRAAPRSSTVRARVIAARGLRKEAAAAASLDATLGKEAKALLTRAADRLELSARAIRSTIAVASTIASLDGRTQARGADLAEALQYRPNADP